MSGILGRKIGMTSVFDGDGNSVVCTVVETGPCVVTQIKTEDTDGYAAVQMGFGDKKEKNTTKALQGHFEAAGTTPKRHLVEFRDFAGADDLTPGDEVNVADVFAEGDRVHVVGTSKGKGFQGVVRRHNFGGVGMRTHGQHNRERAPGSIGASSDPSRVFKGMRMAGRTGGKRAKIRNLEVVRIFADQNAILVKGSVPGAKGGTLEIYKKQG